MSAESKSAGPRPDDHVIVLFGATGDLARRTLLPGLFHLHVAGLLPHEYRVIGSAPESFALTDEEFRAHARDTVTQFGITKPDDPGRRPGQRDRHRFRRPARSAPNSWPGFPAPSWPWATPR